MDKYNCGTCTHACQGINGDGWGENMACADGEKTRFDPDPQHMHPCEHGQPVVATAIAAVEFSGDGSSAWHICNRGDPASCAVQSWHFNKQNGTWYPVEFATFCRGCGRRLPTADQLPAMHEAQKQEGEEEHA